MSIRLNEGTVKTTRAPAKGAVSIWDEVNAEQRSHSAYM
jgi:hypothetical protein